MTDETVTLRIESPDGDDDVTLPAGMLDLLAEDDENDAQVVGDLALFGCAQRAHAMVHHQEGEATEDHQAIESTTMDLFEDRFGVTYGEATGHQH